MTLATWREERNRAQGERIFRDALADYGTGRLGRRRGGQLLARALSLLVLATSLVPIAGGIALIISALPSLGGVFWGGVLIAWGVFLWPARYKLPADALTRADAPAFFDALDAVSAALDAPRIDRVVITEDFNAFVIQTRRHRVLGVGALLWQAITPAERRAVIAHEIAHLVNGDPARGRLIGSALQTLEKWDDLLAPDDGHSDNVIGELLVMPPRLIVSGVEHALWRLMYRQSQRAEYLADALAARAAGPDAIVRLLETLSLSDHLHRSWSGLYGVGKARGAEVVQLLVSPMAGWSEGERADLLGQMEIEALTVDNTHPPTGYRIDFVQALPTAETLLPAELFVGTDAGIAGQLDRIGEKLAAVFDVQ